ncbi:fer-1-like protein 5 [Apteryx mantelli]|uniref:Fer-1-like protein 5 n=1 Tax=Apteryx mantelli TaxID=2696672 RepID=A0ABM4FTT6_9AVES
MLRLVVAGARIPAPRAPGADVHVRAEFGGVPRSTRVVPGERDTAWNETLVWPLGARSLEPAAAVVLRLRQWGHPAPDGDLGATTVPLGQLAAEPSRPLALSDVPLVDRNRQPTGVRVRIIEGRQLQGNNVKPVVKVLIGEHAFRTRIRSGNNPYYNEVFCQHFHETLGRLLDEPIHIQVLDSKAIRAQSVIGVFKVGDGAALEVGGDGVSPRRRRHRRRLTLSPSWTSAASTARPVGRALTWKWLGLHRPERLAAGLRGYLRVSLWVLRAGDTAPEPEEPAGSEEEEEEEAVLLPRSLPACAATLQLRVYRAEDVPTRAPSPRRYFPPALPSGKRDGGLAVEVGFAGSTLPPICDEIRLALRSGDRAEKGDVLGTATLRLSQVSSAGTEAEGGFSGFLPCFGPSFLPLYGGGAVWPDPAQGPSTPGVSAATGRDGQVGTTGRTDGRVQPLRASQEEQGADYRGRILLELSTSTESPREREKDAVAAEDVARAERSLSRREYGLCAVFYSATMVAAGPELVRFEVSVGNYGNAADGTCKPAASATQHGRAVYDGNRYYYLPWYDAKPVVALTCFWEDVSHRWASLNALQAVHDRLEHNVAALRSLGQADDAARDEARRKLLRELLRDCKKALPQLETQATTTALDGHLRTARLRLLRQLVTAAAGTTGAARAALLPAAEGWLQRIAAAMPEPQASVPDVALRMLREGRRVACARVKPWAVLFRKSGAGGKLCGKTQTIFLTAPRGEGASGTVCAQLRVRLWLGLVAESRELPQHLEGVLRVYAETYENQMKLFGKWGVRGLPAPPGFSDAAGKAEPPKDELRPPRGWRWDGDWSVEPQRRLLLDAETNVAEVREEAYENESRRPGGEWVPAPCTDAVSTGCGAGAAMPPKEQLACPQGWQVTDGWRLEVTGAVDDAGWQYGASAAPGDPPPAWHAAEKTYDTRRRRRWLRTRRRDPGARGHQQDVAAFLRLHAPEEPADAEAWEYASFPGRRFHLQPRTGDLYRRRRWHRRLAPERPGPVAPVFLLESSPVRDGCGDARRGYFQLRCYVFQAMGLVPRGAKATADPVAHVAFVHVSQSTRVLAATLEPRWDQTLLFERVLLYGDPRGVRAEPPAVVVEVFDQDGGGAGTFLGRGACRPAVWLDAGHRRPPRLRRLPLNGPAGPAGDLLAAFELLHDTKDGSLAQLPAPPRMKGAFGIPAGIRPALHPVALEVLAWGLRGLRGGGGGGTLSPVRAPRLVVEWGGEALRTPPIADLAANPNFPVNAFLLELRLPLEEEYVPPITLRVLDTRDFGCRPELGRANVRNLRRYRCEPAAEGPPAALPGPAAPQGWIAQAAEGEEEEEEEEEGDWWSKFYAATGAAAKSRRGTAGDTLTVYKCELEAVPQFEGLQDFCQTFPLYRAAARPEGGEDPAPVGEFKGLFRIYPLPEDPGVPPPPRRFQELPPSRPQKCLVRVYVVRAFNLSPRDSNGLCDPYVRVSLGTKKAGGRDQYVPNTLEPVFGRLFEMTGTIPLEKDLQISLFDYDLLPPDQEIGSTSIDLENRLLSRFRAHCGLPQLYRIAGPGRWRDQLTPSRALERFARARGLPAPEFSADGGAVTFGGSTFLLTQFESGAPTYRHPGAPRERLALHLLHACHLVPEHLETRTLYNSTQPGLEQGKLQMWVDVFPASLGPPGPPVDITPRKPQRYELRCIIWNTRDVDLQDTTLTGQRMSDIYVKGWLDGLEEQRQKTDVHYRSLRGDGSFNWRFVFPFDYLPAERLCVLPKKEHFWSLDETVLKVPPKLILQVWDNDKFSADDFLGVLELELSSLPQPARRPRHCTLELLGTQRSWLCRGTRAPRFSLFRQRCARGWWPCSVEEDGKRRLAGKLELSLELLTAKEAEERPAGKGREEPNMYPTLQPPLRPDWSFLWLQAPLRTLHYAVWQQNRCRISVGLALFLLVALLLAFVYSAPGYLAMKLVNPLRSLHPSGSGDVTKVVMTVGKAKP